ncbi:hypothetical protein CKO15_00835 [Halorhodospira abdelmalekii]|uniref:hypothetical protein n=1 Tax=Halorhodospira abdelmalekii TaxID=421629 RepID=UPI0019060B4D|nr:hypothetical protein [Halorhodospira abdelmalekii]MBK1733847.1 hypothetical protein [Halorhodospira abdelmalekii]
MLIFTLAMGIMAVLALLSGVSFYLLSKRGNKGGRASAGPEILQAIFFISALNLAANGTFFGIVFGVNAWVGFY